MKPPTSRQFLFGIMIGVLFGGIVSAYGAWAGKLLLAAQPEEMRGLIIKLGVGMLLLGAAVGGAAAWGAWRYYSRRVDWDRIETEQRLWESGPLGRAWLKVRQRIIDGGVKAKGAVNWKTVIGRIIWRGATVSALALVMPTGAWAQRAVCPAPGEVDVGGDLLFIRGVGIEPLSLGADDLARLPRQELRIETNDGDVVYEGVALAELIARAGVSMERLRGPLASTVIVAEARDGYRAAYTLAELDADFSGREILLADRKNGAALSPDEGPLRIIMFGETRRSRWPRQVHCLRIERL